MKKEQIENFDWMEIIVCLVAISLLMWVLIMIATSGEPIEEKGITIKTVCIYEDKIEEIKEKETEYHNCRFMARVTCLSHEKKCALWECDEGYKLYYFD